MTPSFDWHRCPFTCCLSPLVNESESCPITLRQHYARLAIVLCWCWKYRHFHGALGSRSTQHRLSWAQEKSFSTTVTQLEPNWLRAVSGELDWSHVTWWCLNHSQHFCNHQTQIQCMWFCRACALELSWVYLRLRTGRFSCCWVLCEHDWLAPNAAFRTDGGHFDDDREVYPSWRQWWVTAPNSDRLPVPLLGCHMWLSGYSK